MGDLIQLFDVRSEWKEIFKHEDDYASLHVYVDERTGDVEIFQLTDDKSNRTVLPAPAARLLIDALKSSASQK